MTLEQQVSFCGLSHQTADEVSKIVLRAIGKLSFISSLPSLRCSSSARWKSGEPLFQVFPHMASMWAFVTFIFPRYVSSHTSGQKLSRCVPSGSDRRTHWVSLCRGGTFNSGWVCLLPGVRHRFFPCGALISNSDDSSISSQGPRRVVSCGRSTWRKRRAKGLQNKMILKCCDCHIILVVDECQTIASKTSRGHERTTGRHINHLFCLCAHV